MISRQVSLACGQKNPALESRPLNNKNSDTSSPTPQKMATDWKVSSRVPGARERTFARAVICTLQSGLGMEVGLTGVAQPSDDACELVHTCACGLALSSRNRNNNRLRGPSRPHNVRAGTDHDALFQRAVEAIGDLG